MRSPAADDIVINKSGGGVGATEMFKSDWYVWLIATKNRG